MKRRKICIVVSARPSYSRIRSVMKELQANESVDLSIILTGSATIKKFGDLEFLMAEHGFRVDWRIPTVVEGETPMNMATTTGLSVIELTVALEHLKPDMVVVVADRYETVAASIAAVYQGICLAHFQGGEVSGNIDERVRHANTKLADYHFVATEASRKRLLQMGESESRVFNVGCPSIDLAREIEAESELAFDPYARYGGVGAIGSLDGDYLVVLQHPVTTTWDQSRFQIEETLKAVVSVGLPTFWFWPNVDAGTDGISKRLREFRESEKESKVHFFRNFEGKDFLRLINHCSCVVGNSSVGVREASYLGVPVVNVGDRQAYRERGENVVDVDYRSGEIELAIRTCIGAPRPRPSLLFGDGRSGPKAAAILADVPISNLKPSFVSR